MRKIPEKPKWRPRVPWVAKLRPELKPKVVASPRGRGTMLVPTPLLVAEEVRRVRRGRLVTPAELRRRLALRFAADQTCPLPMGILLHIEAGGGAGGARHALQGGVRRRGAGEKKQRAPAPRPRRG